MKTKTFIFVSLIAAVFAVLFFSCENPVGLGRQLDIEGPIVAFSTPVARKALLPQFTITGTAGDASGIKRLLLKAERNNDPYAKQWQYSNGKWEVSQDYGNTWSVFSDAKWDVKDPKNNRIEWTISIDMVINGADVPDGEYMFIVQAWDNAGFSDDNSYKTRVFILDKYPPTIDILDPYIYKNRKNEQGDIIDALETNTKLMGLDAILDSDDGERYKPSSIGNFLTRAFQLQWIIDDNFDVWSIDLRFYDASDNTIAIDSDPNTPLPDDYIFRYWKNELRPPDVPQSDKNVSPNGSLLVPDLNGQAFDARTHTDGGCYELKKQVTEKTTIKVVALTYDTAKNSNLSQTETEITGELKEIVLGYFIFWPKADEPWITLSDGMHEPGYFTSKVTNINDLENLLDEECYMIYPGRTISADAFHAHGLKEVVYSLYSFNAANGTTSSTPYSGYANNPITNIERNGNFSQTFSWSFAPPPRTGYYVLKAIPYSIDNKEGQEKVALFRVQDITFPNFLIPPKPNAGEPLFNHINTSDNSIIIKGYISDATDIASLSMVWINPESKNYAAMSQLQYFRDQNYPGWKQAESLQKGTTGEEPSTQSNQWATEAGVTYPYDIIYRNRLWNLNVTNRGTLDNPVSGAALQTELESEGLGPEVIASLMGRFIFSYEVIIPLSQLNIMGGTNQALKSQIFMLKAQNPDGKATVETYAPQGDTLAPTLVIDNVKLSNRTDPLIPNTYAVLQKFVDGNTITINGHWIEDSAAKLPISTYFIPKFNVTINGIKLTGGLTVEQGTATDGNGTWKAEIILGSGIISANDLKDTLVIAADVSDIGGNISETGCSWLIESDNLRLMRISSETADNTYNAGKKIEIFIEFSKPVRLTNPNSTPVLILDSDNGVTARAVYGRADGTDQSLGSSTRQYFVYTVQPGHNTGNDYLSVKDIDAGGRVLTDALYPFRWHRGTSGIDGYEEIRLTNTGSFQDGTTKNVNNNTGYYTRTIPTDKESPNTYGDYQYTLASNKHIKIDTAAPTITGITAITAAGDYTTGADIYIKAVFSKPVKVGAGTPQLQLNVANGGSATVLTNGSVRINGDEVTFSYSVKSNDTTNGQGLVVSGINSLANITDIAGTALVSFGGNRTLADIKIDATPVPVPTLKVLYANNAGSIVTNTVNSQLRTGSVTTTGVDLASLYQTDFWIAVQPNTTAGAHKYSKVEYSVNGVNWIEIGNNIPLKLTQTGSYSIIARQTDKAGNVSPSTAALEFNWDPGALLTRISSSYASGTYTHLSASKTIPIELTFRKDITISGTPSITINATRGGDNIILDNPSYSNKTLTFTYPVTNGDSMPSNTPGADGYYLKITDLNITATDNTLVNVSDLITQPAGASLLDNRSIRIETGDLTLNAGYPKFNNGVLDPYDTANGWVTNNESSAQYQGIRSDDGSYWTTLEIQFNHAINKGSGFITIEKINNTDYRLPAVITESQYNNKFRGITDFETYYTKGTNGYIYNSATDQGSDTSSKYVLNYKYNPNFGASAAFTGDDTSIPSTFFTAFRTAENISINVNSQAVDVNGSTLKVRLTGSNAPQVPGVSYTVTYPAGLVTDAIGNSNVGNTVSVALNGVARPFVRIKKDQDVISTQTGGANAPSLTVAHPYNAYVRMDSRTPGTTIQYGAKEITYTVTNVNWTFSAGHNNNNTTVTAGGTTITPNAQGVYIIDPPNNNGSGTNPANLTIGNNNVQGYRWFVRARAVKGSENSGDSYEMAYRTAITYVTNGMAATTGTIAHSNLANGQQIWVRGGDAIGSSTIPGFPFTLEDDFTSLANNNKRAGIRLMRKLNTTDGLNSSRWDLLTWEMNATAYVDFKRGNDTASSVTEVWQYGPRQWSSQRGGWTEEKLKYPIYPGQHRWLNTGEQTNGSAINFMSAYDSRGALTASHPNANVK